MRLALVGGLLALVMAATGCITGINQGIDTVRGATPRFYELRNLSGPTALDAYKSVAVQIFDASPLLGTLPADMPAEVQSSTIDRLRESRMFEMVGPTASNRPVLVIRGQFVDYDPGGSPLRAVDVSENPFVTAQITLIDGDTNRVLGVAMVSGTVKSSIKTGGERMADGVAKAIRDLMAQHHFKPRKE
jgi:hypothetical protein